MPLIGFIDPTHDERAKARPGRLPRWFPVDDLLSKAETASPKWSPWPFELIRSLVNEHQERGDRVSVTALTGGCMRSTLLERKEDYIASLDNGYAALRGTMIHRTLEHAARPGSVAEWRFFTTVDGQELSCSPDLITYDTIWDYKTTENPPSFDYMYTGHKLQLQFNRFIFNNAEKWQPNDPSIDPATIPLDPHYTKIQHLCIVYLGPKGPKVLETVKSVEITNSSGKKVKVKKPDIWTDSQVLKELRPRLEAWKMAWDAYPNWPDGLENYPGWEGPPDWRCPGPPLCYLPNCLAKRYPNGLVWQSPS